MCLQIMKDGVEGQVGHVCHNLYHVLRSLGGSNIRKVEFSMSGFIARVGLDIMIRAMAKADTRARTMSLAVDLDEHHTSITSIPPDTLAEVFNSVHTLKFIDSYCPFWGDGESSRDEPRLAISKTAFPSLRDLTIDHTEFHHVGYIDVAPISSDSDRSGISKLTVINVAQTEETLHSFLRSYGRTIRHLVLDYTEYPNHGPVLDIAKQFALNTLEIRCRGNEFWCKYLHGVSTDLCVHWGSSVLDYLPKPFTSGSQRM